MRILFDTDLVLDVLLDRRPYSDRSATLFALVERGAIAGFLCATALTTIHYLCAKGIGPEDGRSSVQALLRLFDIAAVNRQALEGALDSGFKDYEDGVAHEAARNIQVDAIVTRNLADFRSSRIPVHSPEELLALLSFREDAPGQAPP